MGQELPTLYVIASDGGLIGSPEETNCVYLDQTAAKVEAAHFDEWRVERYIPESRIRELVERATTLITSHEESMFPIYVRAARNMLEFFKAGLLSDHSPDAGKMVDET